MIRHRTDLLVAHSLICMRYLVVVRIACIVRQSCLIRTTDISCKFSLNRKAPVCIALPSVQYSFPVDLESDVGVVLPDIYCSSSYHLLSQLPTLE